MRGDRRARLHQNSILEMVPLVRLATHAAPAPTRRAIGVLPTLIGAPAMRPVVAFRRWTTLRLRSATKTHVWLPASALGAPPTLVRPRTLFLGMSTRTIVPSPFATHSILLATVRAVGRVPILRAGPATLRVFVSMRDSVPLPRL